MSKSKKTSGCDPTALASTVLITTVQTPKDGPPKEYEYNRRNDSLVSKSSRVINNDSRSGRRRSSQLSATDNKSQRPARSAASTNINGRRASKTKSTEITNQYNNETNSQSQKPTHKPTIPLIAVCDEFDERSGPSRVKTTLPHFDNKETDSDLDIQNFSDYDNSGSDSFEIASIDNGGTENETVKDSFYRTSSAKSTRRHLIESRGSQKQHIKEEWTKYGKPKRDNFLSDPYDGAFQRSTTPSSISAISTTRSITQSEAIPSKAKRPIIQSLEEVNDDYFDSDEDDDLKTNKATAEDIKTIYERACRLVGVVSSKRIERELLGDRVYLDYAGLVTDDVKAICIALLNNTTVTRLDLSGNQLCEQAAQYISELISENVFITNLFCATCQLRANAVSNIISSVTKSKNMVVLDLSENKLQDEEVELVASMIKQNKTLRELRLRYCDIDEEGGRILAAAMADSVIDKLDLSWNQLRQKGGAAFCLALGDNNSIRELDLSWNGLGREGCAALEVALSKNTCLVQLDLTCNRVCTICLGHLLKGLESNRALESIKLTKNLISMEDAKLITTTLLTLNKTSIKVVDISDVTVDNEFVEHQEQLQCKKQISVYYGGFLHRPNNKKLGPRDRTLASFDPILVLFEYMKQQNLRLIDLFRTLDVNHDNAISKQELRNGFLSLNMDLPEGVLSAAFDKLDLNSNQLIDIDELKNAHRRILRQTAAMMSRTHCDNPDDGYGDMLHEFQKLVRAAANVRKTPKPKDKDDDTDHGGSKESSKSRLLSPRPRQSLAAVSSNLLDARRSSATTRPRSPSRTLSTPVPAASSVSDRKKSIRKQSVSPTASLNNSPRSTHSSISPRGWHK